MLRCDGELVQRGFQSSSDSIRWDDIYVFASFRWAMLREKNPQFALCSKPYNRRVGVEVADLFSAVEDHEDAPYRAVGHRQRELVYAGPGESLALLWHNAGSKFPSLCDGCRSENQKGEPNHIELAHEACAGKEHCSMLSSCTALAVRRFISAPQSGTPKLHGGHYRRRPRLVVKNHYGRANLLFCHIVCSPLFGHVAPLGVTREVHMSDLSTNNDAWLSKLRSHLDTESYTAGTVSQYMGVARRFVADLNKHSVAITATRPEDIDRYLQQAPWFHPLRHEDSPDYRHWRSTPLNMFLRVVQGQWPPVATAITPASKSH